MGRALGVPNEILDAPPSADLWNDQTDEGELGKDIYSKRYNALISYPLVNIPN